MAGKTQARIAVLGLQGDFELHIARLRELGADAFAARFPAEIEAADGVVLPGGESTTIGKLMARYGLDSAIKAAHSAGKPIYGTCAGMILLATAIEEGTAEHGGQPVLGLMDIDVARNAFGSQIDSFEATIEASAFVKPGQAPMHAVFIRAPVVTRVGKDVDVLARHEGKAVLVRQGNLLASSFHPELTRDERVHRFFLSQINGD